MRGCLHICLCGKLSISGLGSRRCSSRCPNLTSSSSPFPTLCCPQQSIQVLWPGFLGSSVLPSNPAFWFHSPFYTLKGTAPTQAELLTIPSSLLHSILPGPWIPLCSLPGTPSWPSPLSSECSPHHPLKSSSCATTSSHTIKQPLLCPLSSHCS